MTRVTNRQLARVHAALRVRLRMRQKDVARAAGVRRRRVVDLEAGRIDSLRLGEIRASFEALNATAILFVEFQGAELSRILDELHARLLAAVLGVLARYGWDTRIEVTFAVGRERGSIDVLGSNAAEQALLIVEVKSEMPGVDPLLRPLDVKVRLAAQVARRQFGWQANTVSRIVVLPEERTARRQVARHAQVLDQAFPLRSREIRRWLRAPRGQTAGIWFLSLGPQGDSARNPSAIRRVQRPRARQEHAQNVPEPADVRVVDPHNVRDAHN